MPMGMHWILHAHGHALDFTALFLKKFVKWQQIQNQAQIPILLSLWLLFVHFKLHTVMSMQQGGCWMDWIMPSPQATFQPMQPTGYRASPSSPQAALVGMSPSGCALSNPSNALLVALLHYMLLHGITRHYAALHASARSPGNFTYCFCRWVWYFLLS